MLNGSDLTGADLTRAKLLFAFLVGTNLSETPHVSDQFSKGSHAARSIAGRVDQ